MKNGILYTKFNRTRLDQRVPYIFILIPHYDRSETGMYPDERNLRRFIITEFNKKYNIDVFNDFYENDQVRARKLWELEKAQYTYSKVHGSVFSIRILVFRRKDGTDMEEWRKGAHSASILYGKQVYLWTEEDEKISEDVFQLQENDYGSYLDYSKFCTHFQKFINFDYFSIKNTLEGLNIIPLRKDNVVYLEHYKWSRS